MLQLYEHQRVALPILREMEMGNGKGGFLADAMGTGKSATMATHLKNNKIHRRCDIIVCPLSVLKQWRKEILRVYGFNYYEDEDNDEYNRENLEGYPKILIYHGSKRYGTFDDGEWDYILTTYAMIATGELNRYRWGRVVLDESHTIKNGLRKSKAPKCALAAFVLGTHSIYNWCISGTPFNNRMKDIHSQCKFIGTRPYNNPAWWKLKSGGRNEHKVTEWREKYVLRRTKDNLLKPIIYHNIDVIPTKSEKELINIKREHAKAKYIQWKLAQGSPNRAELQCELLALITNLRIISDSYMIGDDHSIVDPVKCIKENSKVAKVISQLKIGIREDPKNGVVIFSQFTSFFKVLEKVIKHEFPHIDIYNFNGTMNSEQREDTVTMFTSSSRPRVLLISLLAGGVGLNLKPVSTVFICEPYYNPFIETQAEERVHRLGQNHQVNVYRFEMKQTVETWINGIKKGKFYQATQLNMVSTRNKIREFSMDDISDLFRTLVTFPIEDDEEKEKTGEKIGGKTGEKTKKKKLLKVKKKKSKKRLKKKLKKLKRRVVKAA